MRFLNVDTLKLEEFNGDGGLPPYAILSHVWTQSDGEVSFQDLKSGFATRKPGYSKIIRCCRQAEARGIPYVWVDTCCIDKSHSSELNEAIYSMYRWYREAQVCFAYLSDVSMEEGKEHADTFQYYLSDSRWFRRGWTLIELIAPRIVVFFNSDWRQLGQKTDPGLVNNISIITGISVDVLMNNREPTEATVAERISWLGNRQTTREEDMAYCLMGLFEVYFPLRYGEGDRSMVRLWEEIAKNLEDYTVLLWTKPKRADPSRFTIPTRSPFPGSSFYSRQNSNCPDWPNLRMHSPVALSPNLIQHLPAFDKAPEGPQVTRRGLKMSLFAKKVRNFLVAWTYCTQEKDGQPGIIYAVCTQVTPNDLLDDTKRYLRGVLTGDVCYVAINRLKGFELHDIYFPM